MTDAYVYRGALYCEECATREWHPHHREQQHDDSDCCPQGPYPNGGGEADFPQHCDDCGVFLENPLTIDGERYIGEELIDDDGDPKVLATWRAFYSYLDDYAERNREAVTRA